MRPPPASRRRAAAGFTLIEMATAAALGSLILAALFSAYIQFRRQIRSLQLRSEVQQSVRFGMSALTRDLSMAGYGLQVPLSRLPQWINWVSNFTNNPIVLSGGGSAPDTLLMAAAYTCATVLSNSPAAKATQLVVASGGGANFANSSCRVVYIGRCELARVTAVNGNTLTVSTDPSISAGLKYAHAAGEPVELVQVLRYSIAPPESGWQIGSYLKREDFSGNTTAWYQSGVTDGLEDLQATRTGAVVRVALRGVSRSPERGWRDPVFGDSFRRITLTNTVFMRNL